MIDLKSCSVFGSRLSKLLTVYCCLLVLSACGSREEVNDANQLMNANSMYCPLGNLEEIELVDQALLLEDKFIFQGITSSSARQITPEEPLILSYKTLKESYEFFKAKSGQTLTEGETRQWRDFKGDLMRWRDYQCSLDLLALKSDMDMRVVIHSDQMMAASSGAGRFEQRSQALKLCRPFESGVMCEALWELHRRQGKEHRFRNHYRAAYEQNYQQKLFKLKSHHTLSFQCEQSEAPATTYLKMRAKPPSGWSEFELKNVKAFVESTWRLPGVLELQLEWTESEQADVKIQITERSLSHVRDDDFSTIFLAKNVSKFQIPLVIAHELGHVFGLPDCYIEYYDPEIKSIIYYEPAGEQQNNLMCSLKWGNQISADAMEQIKSSKCSF